MLFFFVCIKDWKQNNLLEYKDKSWMSVPRMEKGAIPTEAVFFSILSPSDVDQNTSLAIY